MSVIRVVKDKNFFAASNEPFNDERLSWEARGVMGYLLSKPDDWVVRFFDLIKRGPAGEHKVRRILKELEDTGYLVRDIYRTEAGTFDWISTVYESSTIPRKPPDGDTIYRLSRDGDPTDGTTISRLSTRGKPRDILNTELTSTKPKNLAEERKNGGEVFRIFEQEIQPLTPMIAEELNELELEHTAHWVIAAIKEASTNGKRSLAYFKAILNRWKVEGYGSEFKKTNNRKASQSQQLRSEAEMLAALEARRGNK